VADSLGNPAGHTGDDHSAVAVPDEDHLLEVLEHQAGD
jgi:hypothetical protein